MEQSLKEEKDLFFELCKDKPLKEKTSYNSNNRDGFIELFMFAEDFSSLSDAEKL